MEESELAMLDDGSPAPAGTADEELLSRAVSGTPARSGAPPMGRGGDPRSDRGQLFFWLAIIDGLAAVYILPTVIGIARQVECLGWSSV